MNSENYKVLSKIISAVETGGQVYGHGRYDDYTPPYKNTPNEHTITLGWAQNYGSEARKLIQMIYDKDPQAFKKIDTAGIAAMLSKDWVAIRWNPSAAQKNVLIKLISSDIGKACQDELFAELMKKFVADCEATYTKTIPGVMMYCEIRHLGGKGPADRIFKRCKGDYSLDNILDALEADQADTSSSNQVGDKIFWSRHEKCVEFIRKYAVDEDGEKEITMSAISRAKTLLRQPQESTMTGYTPYGKGYFVSAGAWGKVPQKGDVIYFFSTNKGRVGHVGIVEKVDAESKTVHTIEGNTSSTQYAENGGCVARHSYSYISQGGINRVNGFGRPNFEGAGVTADQFVDTAISFLGYLEKRSNSQLDSKTANAGSNNYQRFQRDVGAGNGDQWCQYFVDAMALYTCQGNASSNLQKGSTGEAVKKMQQMLIALGYSCGAAGADGDFGSGTEKALKAFQAAIGCEADGIYGPKTKAALEARNVVKKASDISVTDLLTACKSVMDTARKNGYKYGDSHATPPTTDKIISCDRMIAKALWDLGFTDQRSGGEVVSTLDKYLKAHGFTRSTKAEDIKKGSILLVKGKNKTSITHAFVCVGFNIDNWKTTRYDAGTQGRIEKEQPLKNVAWAYRQDDFVVYNIPAKKKTDTKDTKESIIKKPVKKSDWKATGTATATVNYLNVRAEANKKSAILRQVMKGNRFEVDGKIINGWVHVKVIDQIGYIWKDYIKYDN